MLKKYLMAASTLGLALSLAACQDQASQDQAASEASTTEEYTDQAAEPTSEGFPSGTAADISQDQPLVVDEENKSVYLFTQVNPDVLEDQIATQHGVVSTDGSNAGVAVLHSFASPSDFHQALVSLGAEPGNNLVMEDLELAEGEGKAVEGTPLSITVSWEGQEAIPFSDLLSSLHPGIANDDYRFGGNLEVNEELGTGCTICLASCPVGIVSNAGVTTDEYLDLETYANTDVLPEAGTDMVIQVQIAE